MRSRASVIWIALCVLIASIPMRTISAEPGERLVGQVYGKVITASDIGLTGLIDTTVRFDARDKERWELMGRIARAFGTPVVERFVKEKKIEVTAGEVDAFRKKMPTAPDNVAKMLILTWKTERELQRTFGGRVIFQQFGPEALDARKKLFEQAEKAGDLKFEDAGVRHLFYYYSNMKHTVVAEDALEKPWFFEK